MANDAPITVFLVDDHDVVRRGMAAVIDAEPDLVVVGEAAGESEALSKLPLAHPRVAVVDVRLVDGNGIDLCRQIRARFPDTICLILTSFADDRAIIDAAEAGAAGFVLKQLDARAILDAIRSVAAGRQMLDAAMVRHAASRVHESDEGAISDLTAQERRVFELIGAGHSNREIADQLFLAEKTVKNYVSSILAKLSMTRRTEAAALAARIEERRKSRFD
jgi:DNA-binding NarL/FixJ family response regulator